MRTSYVQKNGRNGAQTCPPRISFLIARGNDLIGAEGCLAVKQQLTRRQQGATSLKSARSAKRRTADRRKNEPRVFAPQNVDAGAIQ